MAQVTVTGNVWDHSRDAIAPSQQPRLWFRPERPRIGPGLLGDEEVEADLDAATGEFTVQLESALGISYVPVLDYLVTSTADTPEKRARGWVEFPPIHPGNGGDISALGELVGLNGIVYGFGPPPPFLRNAVYLDIAGPAIKIYGPEGGNP